KQSIGQFSSKIKPPLLVLHSINCLVLFQNGTNVFKAIAVECRVFFGRRRQLSRLYGYRQRAIMYRKEKFFLLQKNLYPYLAFLLRQLFTRLNGIVKNVTDNDRQIH